MRMLTRQNPRVRLNMLMVRRTFAPATIADYAAVIGINLAFVGLMAGFVGGFVYMMINL